MKARAARILSTGGPEVIEWAEVELPEPGPGEVRMRSTAVGLNFIDTYHRSGLYPVELPSGLGLEAAGVVDAVAPDVADFAPGDRVATFGPLRGAYATARNIPAAMLFRLPDGIGDEVAAAALLKACTTEFLVERCARVEAGWPVLVHAAAGGVGLLLVQWLKAIGAHVIGSVGAPEKAALARAAGADEVVLADEPLPARIHEFTAGAGDRADRAPRPSSRHPTQPRRRAALCGGHCRHIRATDPGGRPTAGSRGGVPPAISRRL